MRETVSHSEGFDGYRDNFLRVKCSAVSERQWKRLSQALTFYPTPDKIVTSYRERKSLGEYWMPRGILKEFEKICPDVRLRDKTSFPKLPKYEPNIVLDFQSESKKFFGQADCVAAMREHKQGLIHRQPGTGKSNIALYFIGTIGTRSLVIVHTEDILQQWLGYAQKALPDMPVGIIRAETEDIQQLTIATIQTLHKREFSDDWWRQFGCAIFDETHHVAAKSFLSCAAKVTSRYFFGMSASKTRADKMHPIISHYIGPIIHEQALVAPIDVTVKKVKTSFRPGFGISGNMYRRRALWQKMIKALVEDSVRNKLIAKKVSRQLDAGRSTLVLSRRIEHLQLIQRELDKLGHESVVLAAKLVPKPERKEILDQFRRGEIKCVLATQLADESLDVPILSCVALTYPGKHTDLVMQQVGRAMREHEGKDSAIILDFVDDNVKQLRSSWHGRRGFYLRAGFTIHGAGMRGRVNGRVKKARNVMLGRVR